MIERTEKEVHVLEEKSGNLARQIEINKEKLYQAKGSSLKELLSLQQSVLNLETEGEETEEKYWPFKRLRLVNLKRTISRNG